MNCLTCEDGMMVWPSIFNDAFEHWCLHPDTAENETITHRKDTHFNKPESPPEWCPLCKK